MLSLNRATAKTIIKSSEYNENMTIIESILELLNPVGTIREFNVPTNPGTLLGFGTWVAHGTGRVTVAIDAGDADFDTVDEEYGEKTHTLTEAELASHNHTGIPTDQVNQVDSTGGNVTRAGGSTGSTNDSGSDDAHNNVQPSIVVYRWCRTA